MTPKNLLVILLALIAVGEAIGQSEDIPIEDDNQFPPEDHLEENEDAENIVEGSGKGVTDEPDIPLDYDTSTAVPIEEIEATAMNNIETTTSEPDQSCPMPCVCNTEGADFVTDCSGSNLKEFPSPLNTETTILKIHNNQLTEIPKTISSLKSLKVLNAENNSIMDLVPGSISELPELTVLKLANNRLLEIPLDLKNSFSLNKLEELDLGDNDIREDLNLQPFIYFESLRKLTLPTSKEEFLHDLCSKMENLHTICTRSCDVQMHECSDILLHTTDEDIVDDTTLPGTIAFAEDEELSDPKIDTTDSTTTNQNEQIPLYTETEINSDADELTQIFLEKISPSNTIVSEAAPGTISQSSRSGVNKEDLNIEPVKSDSIIETPKDANKSESDVKVGAATTETNPGGIDKSVIGFVVAGMVVIVAGITIGKNWSSIRRRFKSNSRTPERGGANANGTSPDEVPLKEKEKSPV